MNALKLRAGEGAQVIGQRAEEWLSSSRDLAYTCRIIVKEYRSMSATGLQKTSFVLLVALILYVALIGG